MLYKGRRPIATVRQDHSEVAYAAGVGHREPKRLSCEAHKRWTDNGCASAWQQGFGKGFDPLNRKAKRGKVRMIQYQAKIYRDGKAYSVEFPDLPGCFSQGSTLLKAKKHAVEALSLYLEESRETRRDLAQPKIRRGSQYHWITPESDVAIPLMIRRIRQAHGLSQNQMAQLLGMTSQQLQKLETPGKSNPTVKTLTLICDALHESLHIQFGD